MKKHLTRTARRVLLTACVAVWITAAVMTHLPPGKTPTISVSDKTLHFVGYFALTCAFQLTLWAYGYPRGRRFIIVLVVMLLYATADEASQQLVNRCAAFDDWLANGLGVLAAGGIDMLVLRFVHFRRT